MKKNILFALIYMFFLSGCSFFEEDSNVVLYPDIVIANISYRSANAGIVLDGGGNFSYSDPASEYADIVLSDYLGSSIVFISPSKDTALFFSSNETGYQDMGIYLYDQAPSDGYYDMEFLNAGHVYFVKSQSGRYARIYLKSYSSDSIICDMELTSDDSPVFK